MPFSITTKRTNDRFLLSYLGCVGFHYPLTEETFTDWLHNTALQTPFLTPSDSPPASVEAAQKEELATYALGLMAVALMDEGVAEECVRKVRRGRVKL